MNKEFNAKLELLIKSEKALFKLEMRRKGRQTVLIAVALLAILIALAMLNVTVYLYLETRYTPLASAAILSGANLIVAVLFFMIASRQDAGAEAESIQEIRNFAWGQVSSDLDGVKQQVVEFTDGVKRVKNSVDSVVNKDFFGLKGIMPIIQALIEMKRKK